MLTSSRFSHTADGAVRAQGWHFGAGNRTLLPGRDPAGTLLLASPDVSFVAKIAQVKHQYHFSWSFLSHWH